MRSEGWAAPPRRSLLVSLLAVGLGLALAGLMAPLRGIAPARAYRALLEAGFGCAAPGSCGLITALQFATPLLFSGLSAGVAVRSGLFSLGQAGQMLLGAAAAGWAAARLEAPGWIQILLALMAAAAVGAVWGGIPGALRAWVGVHEVIVTILLNQVAPLLVGPFGFGRLPAQARLAPLAAGAKLNAGVFLALGAAVGIQLWFQRAGAGYAQRMQAEAPRFALFGGLPTRRAVLGGMLISGALAGLGGAVEVLGVHYRLVGVFSGGGGFDGLAVAALGGFHPLGIALAAGLLGGLRVGALNGLQLQLRIPRELGNAMIALMMAVVSLEALHRWLRRRPQPAAA
jgi:simple sugar transport system permease protein